MPNEIPGPSEDQCDLLKSLSQEVEAKIGTNIGDTVVLRGLQMCTYLSVLVGSHQGMNQRKALLLRKRIVKELDYHFARKVIVGTLKRLFPRVRPYRPSSPKCLAKTLRWFGQVNPVKK